MHGFIFEILEAWVIEQYGLDTWHTIKEVADCNVKDHSFISRGQYQYSTLLDLLVGTSELVQIRLELLLKLFGQFIVGYLFDSEYGSLLRCQGSTLLEWLSHLNAMHDQFQKSYNSEKFCPPVFWCEESEEDERCIVLHYFSHRGNSLVPMVHGIVDELAKSHFQVDIHMDLVGKQDEHDSRYTSWKISAIDESLAYKLKPPKEAVHKGIPETLKNVKIPMRCPVSGNHAQVHRLNRSQSSRLVTESQQRRSLSPKPDSATEGISMDLMRNVFPFHVIVDEEFRILQVGRNLPKALQTTEEDLRGNHIQEFFTITKPVFAFAWDWQSMNRLSHQNFFLAQTESSIKNKENKAIINFKAAMLALSNDKVLFSLSPHVNSLRQLTEIGLSLSDLSLITSQRDAVSLGEYVSKESRKTNSLDKLSKKLKAEQKLSNSLLYNMLPKQVADGLRMGQTVEPRYYHNVTLFFSDIVGFTSLCQQVQPWEVIDLMNQLYSVMDALTDRFDLYKVETVGDSYMCASGVPDADDSHGEKVANFALAVLECTKHVKSPVTGEPIEMRIGIHTGSCTAGVVGNLTPHYALFGDMVNVASRHESTGMPGRIQCSHELFELLQSGKANAHYEFQERGFVDMKGKGESLTYWLECGTAANKLANPSALERLSREMKDVLVSEQWKMQEYFDKDESTRPDFGDFLSPVAVPRKKLTAVSETNTAPSAPIEMSDWDTLLLDSSISREEIQDKIFDVLFSTLRRCAGKGGDSLTEARKDLLHFVDLICGLYSHENVFLNVANVLMRAEFLLKLRKRSGGYDSWDDFVLLFSAFIRDVDLDADEDSRLASRTGAASLGEGMSMEAAIEFLEDDYEDLCEVIFRGCPRFRKLMRKLAVASAELESEANFRAMLMEFDRTMADTSTEKKALRRKSEVQLGMILILATCGHYCQSYEVFLHWNQLQFKAELQAHKDGISDDPRQEWQEWQAAVFKASVYHLLDRTDRFLTDGMGLRKRANLNETQWRLEGKEWVGAILVPYARLEASLDEKFSYEQHINANIAILEHYLRRVIASHKRNDDVDASESSEYMEATTPYEELQLVIEMAPVANSRRIAEFELPRVVRQELRAFVMSIAGGYNENEFHSFRHASHVVLLSNLLMESIDVAAQGKEGVTSDPLVCFAIVLSALVHDVGHTGVPNGQVAEENPELADRYNNQSIAEQNSIDVAWQCLMSKSLKHLQMCLFGSSESEKARLRQLLVNNVMATDIFDKDLRALRQKRWERAATCDHAKKTLAMEHIMQTSDVAHTMQEWDIYREWNESLFLEMYEAFSEGRSEYDPIDGWYNGELWFFDNWVIPLAQNLKSCGVLSIVSDELVARARSNKRRWALEGEKICRSLWQKARERQMPHMMMQRAHSKSSILSRRSSMHSEESTAVETMLAATVVEEIESLSKVLKRYEEKIETACTNLIGLTYKNENHPPAKQLKHQPWQEVRKHFRKQHWYRNLHDGTHREEDDDNDNDAKVHIAPPTQHALLQEEENREDAIHESDDEDDDMSCLTENSRDAIMKHSQSTIVGEVR
ncbi:unnamed protein product [Cylindrotheca closterium]|uniref:guanylate cyclase n=1 Tax=Cylindrotheca closterium TaxID=2856 RepID=A0AAD2GBX1_9STRA|nr:unnamed protein product [Cylindrotheca closterium]